MMRTDHARPKTLVVVGARPCALMRGDAWQSKQGVTTFTSTGNAIARRLRGAPT
jgi:hypothetical protein